MIPLDPNSPVPINDQIKAGLKALVARGMLKPGDQAPSIRALASQLKVNPNTVARAFRELALEGFLQPRRGDGAYITLAAGGSRAAAGKAPGDLREALRQARREGLSWTAVEEAVAEIRQEEEI